MNLDVEKLLTIDVDSEIRKLAEAELGGSWQIPAELVRRSIRAGASTVEVTLSRHGLKVADDGAALEAETAGAAAALLDAARGPHARHRALLDLEAQGEVGLIALAGLDAKSLRITCDGAVVLSQGAPLGSSASHRGVTVEVDGVSLDAAQAKQWLGTAARFARTRVLADGVEVARGPDDAIVETPLQAPLEGTLALVRSAGAARVWLLRWGVVATHTTLAEGLGAEAAVEVGEQAARHIAAGELRHAFTDVLDEIQQQALELAIATAADLGKLAPDDRQRVRLLLLRTAGLAKSAEVRRVKMLPALHGPSLALEWMSIDQLVRHASAHPALFVESEARAADAVTHQPIFVLGPAERARLSQLFKVTFAPPAARATERALTLKGLAESALRGVRGAAAAAFGTLRKRLPVEALTEEERTALEALRGCVMKSKKPAFTSVELCSGKGRAHLRSRGGTLMLPRSNRDVAAALRTVARDPAWAYPALLALLGGTAMPPSAIRNDWQPDG